MNNTQCFEKVDSDNAYKYVFIVATILCIITTVPGFYSVVWFEKFGSDKRRTVFNKLLSSMCYVGMFANVFVQGLFVLRFVYGPLPNIVCFWLCLSKRVTINFGFLVLDSISVVRYIFIFWLKNPAAFNDEFWHVFITLSCILMSFGFQVIRATIPGNQLVEYSLCTGDDPTPYFFLPSFGRGYIESFSLILQISIYIKIGLYKKKARKRIGPETYWQHLKNAFLMDAEKQSLSSLAIDIVLAFVLAFGSVFIVLVNFKSCSDFLMNPKFIVVYHTYMLFPCISTLIFVVVCFVKNPSLRQTILRELTS